MNKLKYNIQIVNQLFSAFLYNMLSWGLALAMPLFFPYTFIAVKANVRGDISVIE